MEGVAQKRGKNYMTSALEIVQIGHSKSLRSLIDGTKYPDVSWGIKLGDANIGCGGGIKTSPYFLAFLLKDFLSEKE